MVCMLKKSLWLPRGEKRYWTASSWEGPKYFTGEFCWTFRTDSEGFLSSAEWMGWSPFLRSLRKEAIYGKKASPGFPCCLKVVFLGHLS